MSANSGEDKMSVENMWVLFACVAMSMFAYAFLKPMCNCSCRKKEPLPAPPPEPVANTEVRVIKIHPARANFRLFPPGEAYYLGGPPRKPVEEKKKKKPKVKDKLNAKWRQCVNTIIANNAIRDLSTQLPLQRALNKGDKDADDTEDPSKLNASDDNSTMKNPNVFSGLPITANNCCGSYSNGGGTMNDFARLVQLVRTLEKEKEKENALNNPDDANKLKEDGGIPNSKKSPLKKNLKTTYLDDELGEDEIRPVPSLTPTPRKEKPTLSSQTHHPQHNSQSLSSQNVQIQKPRKHLLKPNPKVSPESWPVPVRVSEPVPKALELPPQESGREPKCIPDPSQPQSQSELMPSQEKTSSPHLAVEELNETVVEIKDEVTIHKIKRPPIRRSENTVSSGDENLSNCSIKKNTVRLSKSSEEDENFDKPKLKRITIRRFDDEAGTPTFKRITIRRSVVENVDEKANYPNHNHNHCYDNYSYVASNSDLRTFPPENPSENYNSRRPIMTSSSRSRSGSGSGPKLSLEHQIIQQPLITQIKSQNSNPSFIETEYNLERERNHLNYVRDYEQFDAFDVTQIQSQPTVISVSPSSAAALPKRY